MVNTPIHAHQLLMLNHGERRCLERQKRYYEQHHQRHLRWMRKKITKEQNDTIHFLESDHGERKNQVVRMNETKKQIKSEEIQKVEAEVKVEAVVVNDDFLVA